MGEQGRVLCTTTLLLLAVILDYGWGATILDTGWGAASSTADHKEAAVLETGWGAASFEAADEEAAEPDKCASLRLKNVPVQELQGVTWYFQEVVSPTPFPQSAMCKSLKISDLKCKGPATPCENQTFTLSVYEDLIGNTKLRLLQQSLETDSQKPGVWWIKGTQDYEGVVELSADKQILVLGGCNGGDLQGLMGLSRSKTVDPVQLEAAMDRASKLSGVDRRALAGTRRNNAQCP